MKYPIILALTALFAWGCGSETEKEETTESGNSTTVVDSAAIKMAATFKTLSPGFFSVGLPDTFVIKKLQSQPDECDYSISLKNGMECLQIHCKPKSAFPSLDAKTMLEEFRQGGLIQITNSSQDIFGFEITGKAKEDGNPIFLKRMIGAKYVSDLTAYYPAQYAKSIEPLLPAIASTFLSL